MIRLPHPVLIVLLALCAMPGLAAAQVPPSADAGRQETPRAPRAEAQPMAPAVPLNSRAPTLAPALAAQQVQLREIRFEGASAFPPEQLQDVVAPLLGRTVTVAEIFDRMAAVQQLYLDAHYALSRVDIPEQNLNDGILTIRVIEGYIGNVVIDPALADSALVQDVARRAMNMRPLDTYKLERLMLLLSQRQGLEAVSVLAPMDDPAAPVGAVQLIIQPRGDNRMQGFVSLDNHGSNYLGPWRATLAARWGRLFGSDADAGIALTRSTSARELRQANIDMSFPLGGASGLVGEVSAGKTWTEPGSDLDPVDVQGTSESLRAGLTYPVILQRDRTWRLGAAFDYNNVTTDLSSLRIFNDRLRVLTLDSLYSFYDDWRGSNQLSFSYSQGFDILGPRSSGVDDLSREDGESAFKKVTASISRTQALPRDFEAAISIQGQYAWDPLLSAEEFGYGGVGLGRGYDASEIVGDHGVAGLAELRYTQQLPEYEMALQPYAFYDMGRVWNIDPSGENILSGASAGAGMRLALPHNTEADVAVAVPLTRSVDNAPNYSHPSGPRLLLQLRRNF